MNWSLTRRRWERRIGPVIAGALFVTSVVTPVGARSESQAVEAREVRTLWTSEFGLTHPNGLAYIAESGEFVIAGESPAGNVVLLGSDEDFRGSLDLSSLVNPSTLAYDRTTGTVTALNGQTRVRWSASTIKLPGNTARRSDIPSLAGVSSESSTYDAMTGDLLLLSRGTSEIVRVAGSQISKIALRSIHRPELIASNPADGLVYVMSADKSLVAIDNEGTVQRIYDLSAIELGDPTAMVFAPTSDATDHTADQNLFIADSGGSINPGGVVEVSLTATATATSVPVDAATLIRSTATPNWNPGSPDPSGVAFVSDADSLIVVDSEVDEVTGAGWNDVNMWRTSRSGGVLATGTFWGPNAPVYSGMVGFSREPTGAGYDPTGQSLFVSDDSTRKIFIIKKGGDGRFGTSDDSVAAISTSTYGSTDTEDPEFDTTTGDLFFLDGVGREIYRIDPVDGLFGNGNDTMTQFDIGHLGPTDFEGLASNPSRGTLYVGARSAKRIFEITKTGTVLREISVSGISGLRFISGLAAAPSSDNPSRTSFYIADRQVDNGANSTENDGRLWEVRAPDSLGGGTENQAPVVNAGPDLSVTLPSGATLAGSASDDGLPSGGSLTVQWSVVSAPSGGVVTFANANVASTTGTFSGPGSYVLRLTASDTQMTSSDDVLVQVTSESEGGSELRAISQSTRFGTVSGGIERTYTADSLTQDITEVTNAKGLRAKLEHTWTFDVPSGTRVTFLLNAAKSGIENYRFAYSTNGSTWRNMVTLTSGNDYQYILPSGVAGTVLVRVRDVDRTQGDSVKDTVRVDRLVLQPGA